MKIKKVVCPYCKERNWSGSVYCKQCSGSLYNKKERLDIV